MTDANSSTQITAADTRLDSWVFQQYDSHWYLIPRSFASEFEAWVEHLEEVTEYAISGQDAPEWTGTNFDQFIAEHPSQYLLLTKPIDRYNLTE